MMRTLLSVVVVAISSSAVQAFVPCGRTARSLQQSPLMIPSSRTTSRLSSDVALELEDPGEIDPSIADAAVAEVAVEEPIPPKLWRLGVARRAIPISVALTIGAFSVLEIFESIRELSERRVIGHAHGISVLALLRLGRSATFFKLLRQKGKVVRASHKVLKVKSKAIVHMAKGVGALQTQTEELEEQVVELGHDFRSQKTQEETRYLEDGAHSIPEKRSLQSMLTKFVTSPGVAITAAAFAVVACIAEIVDDMKPGAHHGAALLALSEMYYQFRRLKARVKNDKNRTSRWRTSTRMGKLWCKIPVGPAIAIAAATYAGIELWEDCQPGAHHGVAILALAELVENINRSKIVKQLETNLNRSLA